MCNPFHPAPSTPPLSQEDGKLARSLAAALGYIYTHITNGLSVVPFSRMSEGKVRAVAVVGLKSVCVGGGR